MARPPKAVPALYKAIPSNIDLKQLISTHPPTFKGRSQFSADWACVILDTLYRASVYTGVTNDDAFIPIPSKFLKSIVRNYQEYIQWFRECGVIEINEYYVHATVQGATSQCKGYRLTAAYRTQSKAVHASNALALNKELPEKSQSNTVIIVNSATNKEIWSPFFVCEEEEEVDVFERHKLPPQFLSTFGYPHNVRKTPDGLIENRKYNVLNRLTAVLKKVTVQPGYEDIVWSMSQRSAIERNGIAVYLMDIVHKQFRCSFSESTGRLYSPVTQMKREARQFLVLDGCDDLSSVDVRSCHPYLLIHVANHARQARSGLVSQWTIDDWTDTVLNNDLYELLVYAFAEVHAAVQTREYWKEMVQRIFNGQANQKFLYAGTPFYEKTVFQQVFPGIMRVVNFVKQHPTKQANRLSLLLQHLESEIMLWRVCPRLLDQGVQMLTVHDALIVPTKDGDVTRQVMEEEFEKVVKVPPKIKVTRLDDSQANASPRVPLLPPEMQEYYEGFDELT